MSNESFPIAQIRDVTTIGKIVRTQVGVGSGARSATIDSIEIEPSLSSEDLNHIIVRCASILRARAEQKLNQSNLQT